MNHSIKINRALILASTDGAHIGPVTARAILTQIPTSLLDGLTARQLADVYIALQCAHAAGRFGAQTDY